MSDLDTSSTEAETPDTRAGVSVVVPSFNHARFVETALRSIFKQTRPPSELLVIDDGSTDGSPQLIERVLKDCPFACDLVVRSNRGLPATLNEGFARARGKYFAYLGSDDRWLPDFLRSRASLLGARPQAVLGYGHAYLIDESDRILDCTRDWASYSDGDAREMLLQTIAPMSPTVVYRRDALARHGWNETARLEDYELYLLLSVEGEFAFDPAVLSAWRRHGENASWNQRMMLEEHLSAQRRVLPAQGIGAVEIEKLQRQIKFSRAEDFLRVGEKREALRLMYQNLRGLTSWRALARIGARLVLPHALMRWRSERRAKSHDARSQL